MKLINLDELERRVKLTNKPTPYDVLEIIGKMKEELK